MSLHVYHEMFVHLVWHTKTSTPLLIPDIEAEVHEFIKKRYVGTKGIYIHGIGGTTNHLHLALNYEPHFCVSDIVKDLKGACAHEINKRHQAKKIIWQRGYGAVSFGKKNLEFVLDYIGNQKQRHITGKSFVRLEKIGADDEEGEGEFSDSIMLVREQPAEYDACPI